MTFKKKEVVETTKKVEVKPNLVRVMDKHTREIKIIDANKQKDFKKVYLHVG
jgi:hypothetical protein